VLEPLQHHPLAAPLEGKKRGLTDFDKCSLQCAYTVFQLYDVLRGDFALVVNINISSQRRIQIMGGPVPMRGGRPHA